MSDLIERLRAFNPYQPGMGLELLLHDAADEIERLLALRVLIPDVIDQLEALDNWALIPIVAKLRKASQ